MQSSELPFRFMSPPESRDAATLIDMIRASQSAIEFLSGMDEESFYNNLTAVSAVNYQIAVLGEAAVRLSRSLRARYAHIPWRDVIGMRNHLIHGYDDVALTDVWDVVKRDLPVLIEQLRSIQRDLGVV